MQYDKWEMWFKEGDSKRERARQQVTASMALENSIDFDFEQILSNFSQSLVIRSWSSHPLLRPYCLSSCVECQQWRIQTKSSKCYANFTRPQPPLTLQPKLQPEDKQNEINKPKC